MRALRLRFINAIQQRAISPASMMFLGAFAILLATPVGALTLSVSDDASTGHHSHHFKFDNRGFLRIEQWGATQHRLDALGNDDDDDNDDDYDDDKDRDHYWHRWGRHPHHHDSYARFDIDIIGDDLDSEDLLRASLRLYVSKVVSGGTVHVHRVLDSWY